MYSLAWKTLMTDRGKLITALAGVVFSLVLVNVQGGLYFGLMKKASVLIDCAGADIWVGHRHVELVDLPYNIPQQWVHRLRGVPGVAAAEPYIVSNAFAKLPDGSYENVWVIGSDAASMLGTAPHFVEGSRNDLLRPDAISCDQLDAEKLNFPQIGDRWEINGHRAKVAAMTRGILPFTTTPYLFTTLENARQFTRTPSGYCSFFLVKAKPGTNVEALRQRVAQCVPDLDVYRADQFAQMSRDYWMKRTGIGVSFGAATLLGLLVGLLMVGQSLYALALDHLNDYATLKAIGAENWQVAVVLTTQSLSIAAVGTVVGMGMVFVIQNTLSSPLAPIDIPARLLCGGVGMVFLMCLIASVLPFVRILRVDPIVILQG